MATKDNIKREIPKQTGLKKCFTALVDRKQVNLDIDVLNIMLKNELQINMDSLDEQLSKVMPLMLVIYIRNWPGWQRSKEYYSGKLNFKEWYEKFRQYIVVRLNYLIKKGYDLALNMLTDDELNSCKSEYGMQTDNLFPKTLAPFSVEITCSPLIMNSLIFTDDTDNIILKKKLSLNETDVLNMKELLNWPFVSVEFLSPEISFRRNNCGEYDRYLIETGSPLTQPTVEFIEQVEYIEPSKTRNCYTIQLFENYFKEYLSILKSATDVSPSKLHNIEVLFDEFLGDIKEIDMNNTMATNTSVLFNIGKSFYTRRKKIFKSPAIIMGNASDLEYIETYIPKMETSLVYFKAIQDLTTPHISFIYLNIVKSLMRVEKTEKTLGSAMPLIIYKCEYCDVKYKNDTDIFKHVKDIHPSESSFMCGKCMKVCSARSLAASRWKTDCSCAK